MSRLTASAAILLCVTPTVFSQPTAGPPSVKPKMTLPWCLAVARAKQPRIAVSRASLASAEKAAEGLDALNVPQLLVPELPWRRSQAALGLVSARAALAQAERQADYAVTRAWLTAGFARAQEKVARGVVNRLTALRDAAKQQVEDGARGVNANDVDRITTYLKLAQARVIEARHGVERAQAALAEAIGLACIELDATAGDMPDSVARPDLKCVLTDALAAREELVLADNFAEVVGLEVKAQATSHRKRMETFAAGADVHAHLIPQESRDGEFRPGAVQPEMPTLLVGPRDCRVARATTLYARAVAAATVARDLIALETRDAFLRWRQASGQEEQAEEAVEAADRLAENLRKDFITRQRVRTDDVTTAQVTAATARGQLNEYTYHKLIALIDLERATSGRFCSFQARQAETLPPPAPAKQKKQP